MACPPCLRLPLFRPQLQWWPSSLCGLRVGSIYWSSRSRGQISQFVPNQKQPLYECLGRGEKREMRDAVLLRKCWPVYSHPSLRAQGKIWRWWSIFRGEKLHELRNSKYGSTRSPIRSIKSGGGVLIFLGKNPASMALVKVVVFCQQSKIFYGQFLSNLGKADRQPLNQFLHWRHYDRNLS